MSLFFSFAINIKRRGAKTATAARAAARAAATMDKREGHRRQQQQRRRRTKKKKPPARQPIPTHPVPSRPLPSPYRRGDRAVEDLLRRGVKRKDGPEARRGESGREPQPLLQRRPRVRPRKRAAPDARQRPVPGPLVARDGRPRAGLSIGRERLGPRPALRPDVVGEGPVVQARELLLRPAPDGRRVERAPRRERRRVRRSRGG